MLFVVKDWIAYDGYKDKYVEYRARDFYGPFLELRVRQHEKGRIEVKPLISKIETAEVSESHLSLLSKASKELYQQIGKFVLQTKLFDVTVNSEQTEELLIEKLMNLKLF